MDMLAVLKADMLAALKAGQEEMKQMKAGQDEIKAGYNQIKAGYEEMIAEMKAEREKRKVGREKVREQLQQMKEELAEETGAIKEDAKIAEMASEESEDEGTKEVAGGVFEKDSEIMDETSDGIKERERKHKEIKGENEDFDSHVPEVETEESDNAAVKIIETDNEVTKSQLASIERSDEMCSHVHITCSCDAEMEEADVQLTRSAPALQESLPISQSMCVYYSADCADKNLILNLNTSACKGSDSIHGRGVNIGIRFQEIEVNKHVPPAVSIEVKCTHGANKLQSGERTVSDLPVHEKSERTESSDCDIKNRNTSEDCRGKVFDPGETIAYHLENAPDERKQTACPFKESHYVENCITSLETEEQAENFISEAKELMSSA
ncbi:hypothetical protein X975_00966, partial [Stegodyphus mimosarum]